jgi:hypothetical protein
MKKITITQLVEILMNFVGTSIIRLHALTPQNGAFHAGVNGSRVKSDSMKVLLGIDPSDIMKEQWTTVLLTSCSYAQMIKNIVTGAIEEELKELGIEISESQKKAIGANAVDDYEVGERKNGTAINP